MFLPMITPLYRETYPPLTTPPYRTRKRETILSKLSIKRSTKPAKPNPPSKSKMGKSSLAPFLSRFKHNSHPSSTKAPIPTATATQPLQSHSHSETATATTTVATTTTQTTTGFYLTSNLSSTETLVDTASASTPYLDNTLELLSRQASSSNSSSASSSSTAVATTTRHQRPGRLPDRATMGFRGAMAGAAGMLLF